MSGQIFLKYYFQFLNRPGQHPCRDFFAPDFKQEIRSPFIFTVRPRRWPRRCGFRLLGEEIDGDPAGNLADATNQLGAFGGGDDAAGVEQVKKVGTFQAMIVGGEQRKAPVLLPGRFS